MELAYRLSKTLVEKLRPDQIEEFDALWDAVSKQRDTVTVKEKVLPLVGPGLIESFVWPIVIAVTANLITEALLRVAQSRRLSKEMKVEISDKAVTVVAKFGIDRKKANQIVKAIFGILDRHPGIIDNLSVDQNKG